MAQFEVGTQAEVNIPSVNINGTKGTITATSVNDANENIYNILVEEGSDVFEMTSIREVNLSPL